MKKIFLTLFLITLFSCDSDDDVTVAPIEPTSFVKVSVNGVPETFDKVSVAKVPLTAEDGTKYTDLVVTATQSIDPTVTLVFKLAQEDPGTETCYYFSYVENDITYYYDRDEKLGEAFMINVYTSTSTNIKGEFDGKLYQYNSLDNPHVNTVDGEFDITF
jgi:hypothetical protein